MLDYIIHAKGYIKLYGMQKEHHIAVASLAANEFLTFIKALSCFDLSISCFTEKYRNTALTVRHHCQKLFDYADIDHPEQKQRLLTLGLTPDYIIETSPKRYQIFFIPGKTDTLYLSNVLMTDRGSCEADFHIRIPFGINTKYGFPVREVNYNYFMEN